MTWVVAVLVMYALLLWFLWREENAAEVTELTTSRTASPGRSGGGNLSRRLVAEGLGSSLLLAAIIGSGIMGTRLAAGNVAIALLANTLATGAVLVALILTFGPISGGHFNPAVTLADASQGGVGWRDVPPYMAAQVLGAFAGVAAAHIMFGEPVFVASQRARAGAGQLFSEFVATFGLLAVIWGCVRLRSSLLPFGVATYITAAYWFTASTSFANPAVTLARSASDTFAGIRPADVPGFVAAQLIGAALATVLFRWLVPPSVEAGCSAPEVRSIPFTRAGLLRDARTFGCTMSATPGGPMRRWRFASLAGPALVGAWKNRKRLRRCLRRATP